MAEVEPDLEDFREQCGVPGDLPRGHSEFEERIQRHYRIRRKDVPVRNPKIFQIFPGRKVEENAPLVGFYLIT